MDYFGRMNLLGLHSSVNKKNAAKYLQMNADKGNIDSMYSFGFMLCIDDEIDSDKGHFGAMFQYDRFNLNGEGVPLNQKLVPQYIKTSADDGCTDAKVFYRNIFLKEIEFQKIK